MVFCKDKDKVIKRLKDITSYYSFGRVLGYFRFQESGNPQQNFERKFLPDSERLISTEFAFLAGMWLCNVEISKKWPIEDDYAYLRETNQLMADLHLCYKPVENMPFNEQLKEIAFYEGDPGYAWQFLNYAEQKYDDELFRTYLLDGHNFNIKVLKSTYEKIISVIENQINKRKCIKRHKYISPINAFTISLKKVRDVFNKSEQDIIHSLSIKLGEVRTSITDISDRNIFTQYPIIELPNNQGFFIIEPLTLSIAMNETPFYWIMNSTRFSDSKIGDIRGSIAEKIVYNIIRKKFSDGQIFKNIIIKKTKSSNVITDIDILVIFQNICFIFQVKSKRLTELSKCGDWDTINRDFDAAVINAYNQGCKCVTCLKESQKYYSLSKVNIGINDKTTFFNICVTLDQYPTISSMCFFKSFEIGNSDIPLLAMSIYDLELIFDFLSVDEIIEYLEFRSKCFRNKIYGVSEVYYLGEYIHSLIFGSIYVHQDGYKISKEAAMFVDYIVDLSREKKCDIKSIKDIRLLLKMY